LLQKFNGPVCRDIFPTGYSQQKADIVWGAIVEYFQGMVEFGRVLDKKPRLNDFRKGYSTSSCIPILDKFLADDYSPPKVSTELQVHLWELFGFYSYFADARFEFDRIPSKAIFLIDLSCMKLLFHLGRVCSYIPQLIKKTSQKKGTRIGKRTQNDKTKDSILQTYKKVGAIWCNDDDDRKPILLGEKRVTIARLSGEIFRCQGGVYPTQRWIQEMLKEMKKEGRL